MIGDEMKGHISINALALKLGMSRQNFYKGRRAEAGAGLAGQLVRGERAL
jgi:hypothetical protein